MTDYEFSARLRDDQVLKALQNIDANIDKLTKNGEASFNRLTEGANKSAAGLGVVTGASTVLITKLIQMGQEAARAFAEIVKGSIEAAKGLEKSEASLTGIFGGDPSLALAALDEIRKQSIKLGIDLTDLAPVFLPRVQSLDQFQEVAKLATAIGQLPSGDPKLATRALVEALSGDLVSLQRAFELDVTPIREAQAELGNLEGLLVGLQKVLKDRGQDFDTLADTAAQSFNQTKQIGEDAKKTLGEPILDNLKEDFQELNNYLLENKDDLDLVVGSLGDLVGEVADFSGDQIIEFVQNLDPEKVLNFVTNMKDAVKFVEIIIETAKNGNTAIIGFGDGISNIGDSVKPFRDFLIELITLTGKLTGELNAFQISFSGAGLVANKFLTEGFDGAARAREQILADAETARLKGIEDAAEIVNELTSAFELNDQQARDRADSINSNTDADRAAVDASLANKQALEAEAKAAEEAASAQEKYNDARDDFEIDKSRAADDLALKQQRALLDAEIEFAQKREDLARKNAAAIENIYRKNKQRISDAAIDLRRDEEDIARKGARSQIEIEREAANRRVEIETDFRRELQRIRERFDFDAQEAIRQNDAIAFLRIQRQKDFELSQAKQQRDEEIQDAETSAIEQRQKLQEQLQAQIEDARIANQRKLEDLRLSLQRELQEQQIKYAREVQEAKIAEQRKRDELARTFQRQQEDFQRFWDRKLQDLIRNYQKELQIIQQYEAQKAQIMAQSRARAMLTSRSSLSTRDPNAPRDRANAPSRPTGDGVRLGLPSVPTGSGYTPQTHVGNQNASDPFERFNRTGPGRRFGGYTPGGISFLFGEDGPEVATLPVSGYVTPNHRLRFNPSTAGIVNNTNITNRNVQLDYQALSTHFSPQQIAIINQLANQLMLSMYK